MRIKNMVLGIVLLATPFASFAFGSCSEFNKLGEKADNVRSLLENNPTPAQMEIYKKILADHASDIASSFFPSKKKDRLDSIIKNKQLGWFMSNGLAVTRSTCFTKPNSNLEDVIKNDFDYLITGGE